MRVGIVGAGRVGIITGIALFERGHEITLVDVDSNRVSLLREGRMPYYEPGADDALRAVSQSARWSATGDVRSLADSDAIMIAVPTPSGPNGDYELDALGQAVSALDSGRRATRVAWRGVFLRSTVLPGTTEHLWNGSSAPCPVGYLPEFLREGTALADARRPDRIVVGATHGELYALARELFGADVEYFETDIRSAELIKTANNALLSTCISFANEMARLAEIAGADTADVFAAMHLDRRLRGSPAPGIVEYLRPGPGFGGSCLRKDLAALVAFANSHGQHPRLLEATLQINATQPEWFVDRIEKALGALVARRVLVLGLAFKPGTDDSRESVTLPIVRGLARRGAVVGVHDPMATATADPPSLGAAVVGDSDFQAAFDAAEAVILVTPWSTYLESLPALLARRATPLLFADSRGSLRDAQCSPHVAYLGFGGGKGAPR